MEEIKFEPGKYYRHTTGKRIHVIGYLPGSRCWHNRDKGMLVGEELDSFRLTPLDPGNGGTVNWIEESPWIEGLDHTLQPAKILG